MTRRTLVAGIDTSTQARKVVVRDAATGALVREGRASHAPGHRGRPGGVLLCGLADALEATTASATPADRVLLVGGGARSDAVRRLAPAPSTRRRGRPPRPSSSRPTRRPTCGSAMPR